MKRFKILITRDVTESVVVEVNAENQNAAEDAALKGDFRKWAALKWERDENSEAEPYATDGDEMEG